MCRLAILIVVAFSLFASEALLSPFEIVVLAFAALPSAFWKIKAFLFSFGCPFLRWLFGRDWRVGSAELFIGGLGWRWDECWLEWLVLELQLLGSGRLVGMVQRLNSSGELRNLGKFSSLLNSWVLLDHWIQGWEEWLWALHIKHVIVRWTQLRGRVRSVVIVNHNVINSWCSRSSVKWIWGVRWENRIVGEFWTTMGEIHSWSSAALEDAFIELVEILIGNFILISFRI